jgi:hypothetical protein
MKRKRYTSRPKEVKIKLNSRVSLYPIFFTPASITRFFSAYFLVTLLLHSEVIMLSIDSFSTTNSECFQWQAFEPFTVNCVVAKLVTLLTVASIPPVAEGC